jgi:hypothetical protein
MGLKCPGASDEDRHVGLGQRFEDVAVERDGARIEVG